MQFHTVRVPTEGTHRTTQDLGDRVYDEWIRFRITPDHAVEGIAVDASAAPDAANFWAVELFLPDIAGGVREGWEFSRKRSFQFCCIRLTILDQGFHNLDTDSHNVREESFQLVFSTLKRYSTPLPTLSGQWLTSDVVAIARGIHANSALDGIPALTDALIEAGCDDPLVMEHLQTCPDHSPSCWVVEMILDAESQRLASG